MDWDSYRFDPTNLGYLGFLAALGWFVDSLRPLAIFGFFFLFWFWPLGSTVRSIASPAEDPTDWIQLGDRRYYGTYFLTMLPTMVNPYVVLASLGQIGGQLVILARYSLRLPGPEDRTQTVDYRLPFDGTWTVINGSVRREHSHSWSMYTQRYAYDFLITDEQGRTHLGDGRENEDYYCFDEPIRAPAGGVVVDVADGHRDGPRPGGSLDVFQRDIRGNYVTIDHGDVYSVLAHLTPGSFAVDEGQRVERGELIGRCGNSGNSTEPHLHFHVQDHPNFYLGMGLPIEFERVRIERPTEGTTTTAERAYVEAGQRVSHGREGPRTDRETRTATPER
ncbi:M23 family metallopeptidase [Halovivax limisalsi]|uniref:M23 family metallopeptidase n=1 Tax=Halovivax limisalsi TaxID=1453760 RepID=UPI001FFCFF8D|nr:M23 family metallopeptidase [Halovivax limisalsi]